MTRADGRAVEATLVSFCKRHGLGVWLRSSLVASPSLPPHPLPPRLSRCAHLYLCSTRPRAPLRHAVHNHGEPTAFLRLHPSLLCRERRRSDGPRSRRCFLGPGHQEPSASYPMLPPYQHRHKRRNRGSIAIRFQPTSSPSPVMLARRVPRTDYPNKATTMAPSLSRVQAARLGISLVTISRYSPINPSLLKTSCGKKVISLRRAHSTQRATWSSGTTAALRRAPLTSTPTPSPKVATASPNRQPLPSLKSRFRESRDTILADNLYCRINCLPSGDTTVRFR